jgi:hypothetical protein
MSSILSLEFLPLGERSDEWLVYSRPPAKNESIAVRHLVVDQRLGGAQGHAMRLK